MEWRAWHELSVEARDAITGAAERVVTDCEEGVREAFGTLARQLVDHHRVLREHIQHILTIAGGAHPDRAPAIIEEVRNVAAAALNQGVIHDVPRPHPLALRGLGKMFWDAVSALPPDHYLRGE